MTIKIGYYACEAKAKRNAEFPIHVVYGFDRDWPESVLRQRGILGRRRLHREAHAHEADVVENSWRAVSYKYRSLDLLVEDELRAGTAEEFIDKLRGAFKTD